MKLRIAAVALLMAISAPVTAAEKAHATDDLSPKHGGVVAQARDLDFELVAKPEVLTVYVRDHGKPVDTKGATGKILLLVGTQKTEATLTPAGDNRLQAKGNFNIDKNTKAVATVRVQGKPPANVRFSVK